MTLCLRLLAVAAAIGLLAGACGGNDDDDGDRRERVATSTATATSSPTPENGTASPTMSPTPDQPPTPAPTAGPTLGQDGDGQPAPADQPQEPSLVLTPVVSLPDPIALVARPGTGSGTGDLYVAARAGQVWLLSADGDEPSELVLDIGEITTDDCENGLLGLAFSPDGSHLYVHYTDLLGNNQIVEYPMGGQRVRSDQGRTVLSVDQPFCNHNGGHIAFGPDGHLWLGFGDGGGSNDQFGHGQNLDSLLATMVRINPEAAGEASYTIPSDNPFTVGEGQPEIWAYGARNPWRFSFDRATGDLWIADVGQNDWEEIHVLWAADGWAPSANLGWPLFEGNERFAGTATPDDLDFPVHVYSHDVGCSVTGGHVYRGSAIPHLEGAYVFGDYCAGRLWALTIDDEGVDTRVELGLSVPQVTLVSFGEDASGELYVLSFGGTVYRLEPAQ
ncbi:PQQ-dependent sugar dehydrogenase [Candidatus Poriferisocius sp.]|uniref:PQQ-dependent sugar dehydrogenase n=1 Tax=Candidatus Poriferisocius sp. TaxID=3101276 RepID=UPI003B02DCE2